MKIIQKLKVKIDNFLLFFFCFGIPFLIITHNPSELSYKSEIKDTNQMWKKIGGWQDE